MNTQSALFTVPSAVNFRQGFIKGYSRFYNLVSITGLRTGSADLETLEVAALSIRPSAQQSSVLGILFDILDTDLNPYLEREHRYKAVKIEAFSPQNVPLTAWTVIEQSDEAYKASMSPDEYYSRVEQYYSGFLWSRKDILPMREYMKSVLIAASALGGIDYVSNMLDNTYLADDMTTLRRYLEMYPDRSPFPSSL